MSTILVVDDTALAREAVSKLLEYEGFTVLRASHGRDAWALLYNHTPDLVLLDLAMPVMNGLEAARLIASVSPHPVMLMFTMQYTGQLLKEAEAAGIKEVLSKTDAGIECLLASMRTLLKEPPANVA